MVKRQKFRKKQKIILNGYEYERIQFYEKETENEKIREDNLTQEELFAILSTSFNRKFILRKELIL